MTSNNPEDDLPDLLTRLREALTRKPTLLDVVEHLAGDIERNVALLKVMRDHTNIELTAENIDDRHGGAAVVKDALRSLHKLYLERYEARKPEAHRFYDQVLKARTEATQRFLSACNDPRFYGVRQAVDRQRPAQFEMLPRVLKSTSEQAVALLLSLRQAFQQWDKNEPGRGPSLFQGE